MSCLNIGNLQEFPEKLTPPAHRNRAGCFSISCEKKESNDVQFSAASEWSLENELRCFVIFKKLEVESFPHGRQSELCHELENKTELSFNTINAKVGNFKSEAGVTGESHPSAATKYIMKNYGKMSLPEAEALIEGYLLFQKANA